VQGPAIRRRLRSGVGRGHDQQEMDADAGPQRQIRAGAAVVDSGDAQGFCAAFFGRNGILMWPFKKKESKEPIEDLRHAAIEKIEGFRKIGETFNYLGRTCVVTGHQELIPMLGVMPMLRCDYADDAGVLHSIKFLPHELPALIAQQSGEWEF